MRTSRIDRCEPRYLVTPERSSPTVCIVEIRGTQGCALVGESARAVQGSSQGTTLSASDLHNARTTILNPFYNVVTRREGLVRQGRGVSLIAQSNAFISYAYDL